MRFSKLFFTGIFSVLLFIFFVIYRKDNMLQISAAFFALIWFVQVPGSLLLILAENKIQNYLRLVLFGNVIGLALVPLLYYSLYYFNLHQSFEVVLSVLNIVLGLLVMIRISKKKISAHSFDISKLNSVFLLLAVVMVVCSIREFSQMLSWNFQFNSKRDTDAGVLMSMVIGLKNYGYLVNMNYSSVAVNYHHFIYLLMALVMKTSHVGILPLYQVVFPLYSFFFIALAAYHLLLTFKVQEKVAMLGAITLLFLDDFYLLNQAIKVVMKKQPFFTIESIEWLHNSPSTAVSFLVLFVIIAELAILEKQKIKNSMFLLLLVSIGTLACYKISTWACLAGGLLAATVLTLRKNPKLALLSVLGVISGFVVNKFLSGFSTDIYTADGMNINLAYPLLRSETLKKFLHFSNDIFTFHDLTIKTGFVLAGVSVFYLIGIFGVRLFYFFRKDIRVINFTLATILFTVLGGIFFSFMVTPSIGQHNTLYFILTGMFLLSVLSFPSVYNYLSNSGSQTSRVILAMFLLIQLGSGLLQVLQPVINPVKSSSLSPGWFEAMNYMKENTEQNSLLAYNRLQLKENYYKDDFDFVPVFTERAVVLGGKYYFSDYELKKQKVDSLFSSSSLDDAKRISGELKIDYILFDKWKGGKLPCSDSSYVIPVFTNQQVDIYKVKRS